MESKIKNNFHNLPALKKFDFLFVVLGALLWWGAVSSRGFWITPTCIKPGAHCTAEAVFFLDRFALGFENGDADALSYVGQNSSGIIAFFTPTLWLLWRGFKKTLTKRMVAILSLTHLILLLECTIANGILNEIFHAFTHRARPFVYSDPIIRGADPAHYTSFYSGHTSFAAVASTCLVISLASFQTPRKGVWAAALLGAFLTVMTGVCRILAGRHFPTDVVAAIFIGVFVASGVQMLHRSRIS